MSRLFYYIWLLIFIYFSISQAQEKSHRGMIEELKDAVSILNKNLRDEIAKKDKEISDLKDKMNNLEKENQKLIENLRNIPGNIIQVKQILGPKHEVATSSRNYAVIEGMSTEITTTNNSILVLDFSASIHNKTNNSECTLALFVNDDLVASFVGAYCYTTWITEVISGSAVVALKRGEHTIQLRWKTTSSKITTQSPEKPNGYGNGLVMKIMEINISGDRSTKYK